MMRNHKVISILVVMLLVLLNSNISFADTGIVNTAAVRVREKATTDSKVLTRAYEDDEVEILGEEGDWYQVKVNGKTGYASKSLINKKSSSSENKEEKPNNSTTNEVSENNTVVANETTENNTVQKEETTEPEPNKSENENNNSTSKTVIKDDTVGRVMPNFASNELVLLTKGTEIEVSRDFNNWSEVVVNGRKIWVLKNRIEVENTAEPAKPEETKPAETKPEEPKPEETKPAENTTENTTNTNTSANTTNESTNTNTNNNTTTTEARATKGIINVETANIREKPSSSAKIIDKLDEDDEVTILSEEGDWYKIKTSKIESGYVAKRLVKASNVSSRGDIESREEDVQETVAEEPEVINKGAEVVEFAKQYLGLNYVLGGKTPETGFDCSGYTRYVFKNFGYSLGTVAAEQNNIGEEIGKDDLKEGDLILFYNEENTKIGHTGIYIGNNEFIHAANPDRGIVTDNLVTNSYYSTRFVTARRIVE